MEWGAWLGFSGKEETLTAPALALMVDMFTDSLIMLPRSERKGLSTRYVFSLDGALRKLIWKYNFIAGFQP